MTEIGSSEEHRWIRAARAKRAEWVAETARQVLIASIHAGWELGGNRVATAAEIANACADRLDQLGPTPWGIIKEPL